MILDAFVDPVTGGHSYDPRLWYAKLANRVAEAFETRGLLRFDSFGTNRGYCDACSFRVDYYVNQDEAKSRWFGRDGLEHWYKDHTAKYSLIVAEFFVSLDRDLELLRNQLQSLLC